MFGQFVKDKSVDELRQVISKAEDRKQCSCPTSDESSMSHPDHSGDFKQIKKLFNAIETLGFGFGVPF